MRSIKMNFGFLSLTVFIIIPAVALAQNFSSSLRPSSSAPSVRQTPVSRKPTPGGLGQSTFRATTSTRTTIVTPGFSSTTKVIPRPPESITLGRNIGILSGRTRVRIMVKFNNTVPSLNYITNVYFGDTPQMAFNNISVNGSFVYLDLYSPPAHSLGNVTITVQYSDGYNWTDPTAYFEYRPNPTISNVHPKEHLTSGGTRVTIEGSNLDAAEASSLQLTVTVYRKDKTMEIRQPTTADCFGILSDVEPEVVGNNNNNLLCRMPELNLPDDFLQKLIKDFANKSIEHSNRRRRSSTNSSFEVAEFFNENNERAVATLEIKTDGFEPLPDTINTFTFSSQIFINNSTKVIRIKYGNPDKLELKGGGLNSIAPDNFVVSVGNVNCTNQAATYNVLLCLPPKYKPNETTVGSTVFCNSKQLDVLVSINLAKQDGLHWFGGCAEYYNPFPVFLVVLVTVLVGLLVVILLTVLVVVCYKKFCKHSSQKSEESELKRTSGERGMINPANVVSLYLASRDIPSDKDSGYIDVRITEYYNGSNDSNYNQKIDDLR